MKRKKINSIGLTFILGFVIISISCRSVVNEITRDPLKWPFSQQSIWNMPIGDGARYVKADLEQVSNGLSLDEDLIVLTPDAPMLDIYESSAGWDQHKDRCVADGPLLYKVPFPKDLVYDKNVWLGTTPNAGLVSLMPDGKTIKQSQPFARCESGKPGTSLAVYDDQDIYGEGMYGAHGGSGLSAFGGCIRVGELMPGSGPIRHAMKMNIWAGKNIKYDEVNKGHIWPAPRADGYAADVYGKERVKPFVNEVLMGALMALPGNMNLDTMAFETEPGKRLAQAFQDYGAYIVDDTYWDTWAIETEWGPDGRWADQFKKAYGFEFETGSANNGWARDMQKIFNNLHVVANNTPNSIGGGGTPRRPLAPPFETKK